MGTTKKKLPSSIGPTIHAKLYMERCAVSSLMGHKGQQMMALRQETGLLWVDVDWSNSRCIGGSSGLDDNSSPHPWSSSPTWWRPSSKKRHYISVALIGTTEAVRLAKAIIAERYPSHLLEKKVVWIPEAAVQGFCGGGGGSASRALLAELAEQPGGGGIAGIAVIVEDRAGIRGMRPVSIEGTVAAVESAVAKIVSSHGGSRKAPPPPKVKEMTGTATAILPTTISSQGCAWKTPPRTQPDVPPLDPGPPSTITVKSSLANNTPRTSDAATTSPGSCSFLSAPETGGKNDSGDVVSTDDGNGSGLLLDFLRSHETAFRCPAADFYRWLRLVDVETLEDLAEALADDDFVREEMKPNGFKAFKRGALKRDIAAAAAVLVARSDRGVAGIFRPTPPPSSAPTVGVVGATTSAAANPPPHLGT